MNSSLCQGWVQHRRWAPRPHAFRYRVGLLCLDLDEQLDLLALSPLLGRWRFAPLCWRERDYLPAYTRQGIPLSEAVRDLVGEALGEVPRGRIELLTQPRCWGLWFNPVSFYFCHDDDGRLAAILCEVRNTPWRERYHYVVSVRPGGAIDQWFDKRFHVSPFLPRDTRYHMRFLLEGPHIRVHIESWRDERKLFEAGLAVERQPLTAKALRRHVVAFPWTTLSTLSAIYWQALRLLIKGAPIHDHQAPDGHLGSGRDTPEDTQHVQ